MTHFSTFELTNMIPTAKIPSWVKPIVEDKNLSEYQKMMRIALTAVEEEYIRTDVDLANTGEDPSEQSFMKKELPSSKTEGVLVRFPITENTLYKFLIGDDRSYPYRKGLEYTHSFVDSTLVLTNGDGKHIEVKFTKPERASNKPRAIQLSMKRIYDVDVDENGNETPVIYEGYPLPSIGSSSRKGKKKMKGGSGRFFPEPPKK